MSKRAYKTCIKGDERIGKCEMEKRLKCKRTLDGHSEEVWKKCGCNVKNNGEMGEKNERNTGDD